jgi:RNA polymerase sigma factor (TIGR02999 family)
MISSPSREQVTRVLIDWSKGDRGAAERLMPLIYDELRQIARGYLQQERADHTLQATGLVHEAYLRLVDQTITSWQSRAHFFGVAAQVMRRLLVDHARRHRAEKRGGNWDKLELDEVLDAGLPRRLDLVMLDDALQNLAQIDPRQSQVVELRFFGGLTTEETAEVLDVSPRTIKREWRRAKAWLHREIMRERGIEDAV